MTDRNTAILILREAGFSYQEIADKLGLTKGLVRGVVERADISRARDAVNVAVDLAPHAIPTPLERAVLEGARDWPRVTTSLQNAGWLVRVDRGVYRLTAAGKDALSRCE